MNTPDAPLAVRAPRPRRHAPPHPVVLAGLRAAGDRTTAVAPRLVERRDADFVEGLLADLRDPARHAALASPAGARLFPPVQRVFNCLVLEAFCNEPGQPRIDPRRIDSAGFVLRRVRGTQHLAWLKAGTRVVGWEAVDESLDPAADRRAAPVVLGHPALDRRTPAWQRVRSGGSALLAASAEPVSEDVQPLFVAPPDVNAGAGRTLLFGTLRIGSGELAQPLRPAPAFGTDAAERALLRDDLALFLKAGGARPLPLAGRTLASGQALGDSDRAQLDGLIALLQQLDTEFGAFGPTPAALALRQALQPLRVRSGDDSGSAWAFLQQARAVLVEATPGAAFTMPHQWEAVSAAQADAIFEATLKCLQAQYAQVLPAPGRFDAPGQGPEPQFVVRAFLRLKPEHTGCGPRLLWSEPSAPFTIAPWFESSGAPVPVIPMPDLLDRAQLARVKPSVAFALPPKLAALLREKPDRLMEGKGSGGDGLGLGWICSFSLPIITLCAFIVLNIFLQLLALIFFWLPFLKICLPIPKAKD